MKLITKKRIKGEDVAVTTSRKVASFFGKRHDNVVRDIEGLIKDLKSDTSKLRSQMFTLSTYKNRGKDYKQYLLTQDGFTLLAMGFTGAKALEFKLAYINAFNVMTKAITEHKVAREVKNLLTIK